MRNPDCTSRATTIQKSAPHCHVLVFSRPHVFPAGDEFDKPAEITFDGEPLFRNHPVRPFHQRNENCRIAILRPVVAEIGFGYAPGSGAGTAGIDRNVPCGNLVQEIGHLRPSHWRNCLGHDLAHQNDRFAKKEYLHLVSRFGKG